MDWIATIVVGVLAFIGTAYGAHSANKKQTAIIAFRLEELEKRVSAHNNLVERMYECEARQDVTEERMDSYGHRIKDLEENK